MKSASIEKRGALSMIRYAILAASAAILAAPALAQAVPADIELEGPILSFNNPTSTLEVMGMQVFVPATASVHSPAATRQEAQMNLNQWFRGVSLPGRTALGFLGGTAIVIGVWDPATGRVIADDISVEPAENVSLGVITSNFCSSVNCDAPGDFIRGNSKVGGGPGPAMMPIRDPRMIASPVGDEGAFALDLTGADLTGLGYVAEGYFGQIAVPAPSSTGTVSERSFHYFLFNLTAPQPQLLLNKTLRELTVERAQCRVGKDFEVRGSNHSRVNNLGNINDTVGPGNGVVEVQYVLNGVNVRQSAAAIPTAAGSAFGGYRVRFNIAGACPSNINVRWMPVAGGTAASAYATVANTPVDIRLD